MKKSMPHTPVKYINCEHTYPWLSAMQKTQQILDVAAKLWANEGYSVNYRRTEVGFVVTIIDENKSSVFIEAQIAEDLGIDTANTLVGWRRLLSELKAKQVKTARSNDLTQYFDNTLGTH